MNRFSKIIIFFSSYANPFEKKVGKFFKNINDTSPLSTIHKNLGYLIQHNIVAVNLWSESIYKGYKYLSKPTRKLLYDNTILLVDDFNIFASNDDSNFEHILNSTNHLGANNLAFAQYKDNLIYLYKIMNYLSPSHKRYVYRESCTFGELLKDPKKNQLIGDCNQIVTLYIYLYSLRFDINDLKIKTLPGHVCLHFKGIDIEATNGQFAMYNNKEQKILPIQEIISVNLLDTTDSYFKTHKISPKAFLESARLAYLISSEREIVNNNLKAAYNNIVNDYVKNSDYNLALTFAKQSKNHLLTNFVGHNGALFYLQKKDYNKALNFANYSDKKNELKNNIIYNQGISFYQQKKYQQAINAFKQINNIDLIKKCYIGLFYQEQEKLTKLATKQDIISNKSTIQKMNSYAKSSGEKSLVDYTNSLIKYL